MSRRFILAGIGYLALCGCGLTETAQDGVSPEDARALDEAAEKLDRETNPADAAR